MFYSQSINSQQLNSLNLGTRSGLPIYIPPTQPQGFQRLSDYFIHSEKQSFSTSNIQRSCLLKTKPSLVPGELHHRQSRNSLENAGFQQFIVKQSSINKAISIQSDNVGQDMQVEQSEQQISKVPQIFSFENLVPELRSNQNIDNNIQRLSIPTKLKQPNPYIISSIKRKKEQTVLQDEQLINCLKKFNIPSNNFSFHRELEDMQVEECDQPFQAEFKSFQKQERAIQKDETQKERKAHQHKRKKNTGKTIRQAVKIVQKNITQFQKQFPFGQWNQVQIRQRSEESQSRYPKRIRTGRLMYWCQKGVYKGNKLVGVMSKDHSRAKTFAQL